MNVGRTLVDFIDPLIRVLEEDAAGAIWADLSPALKSRLQEASEELIEGAEAGPPQEVDQGVQPGGAGPPEDDAK